MIAHKNIWAEESYQKKMPLTIKIEKVAETVVINKFIRRRLMLFGMVAGIVGYFMISSFIHQSSMLHKKQQEKAELKVKLDHLQAKEKKLNREIVNLNDPEYIGKIARKDYFLSKKGEVIFQLGTD
jgi:cell division protein DivIC